MTHLTRTNQAYAKHSAMVLNHNRMWKAALIDSKDGTRVENADGTLRHEDHRRIMEEVTIIRRRTLNGVMDLLNAGLRTSEDLGTMLVGVENINEFQEAKRSMNPTAEQNNDTDFALSYVPLPITHQSWRIPMRQMGFSYKNQLGMTESVRQVGESLEDLLFNGTTDILIKVDGVTDAPIFGYTTHPNRVTFGITDWSDLATNGDKIIPETLGMVDEAFKTNASSRENSLMMYVGNDIWTSLQDDYSALKGDRTFVERIKQISQIADVKPAEKLTPLDVVLVEMDARTIQMAVASDIITVPHQRQSDFDAQVFTTYAAMVPIIRSDRNDRTGIVHGVETL